MRNNLPFFLFTLCIIFFNKAIAQYNLAEVKNWQEKNTKALGGRTTLMILKDDKIVFSNSINELTRKQKFVTKIVARRTGKDKNEMLQDFDEETKMPIASCSKWLSAALIMTFVDEGKLKINDTVGKFLPILSKAGKGSITIAHCLGHSTGINAGSLKESMKGFKDVNTMDEAMEIIAQLSLDSKPGESFRYSNIGLQIAGAVIEKISGRNFRTLFEERIAKPCQMLHTDFGKKPLPLPAGGAESTAEDYLHFLQMILNNGLYIGKVILKKETVALMQHNYTYTEKIMYLPEEAGNWAYGFGEWIMDDAKGNTRSNVVSRPGLFGTFPWVDNKNRYAAILFTYNVKSKGRHEKYLELKTIVDTAITNNR
jgi:CubicO group peptidase (beta-lactamase class C family)